MITPFSLQLILLQAMAFGKNLPWSYIPFDFGRWIWLLISTFAIVQLLFPAKKVGELPFPLMEKPFFLKIWLLSNLVYLIFSYYQFQRLGYSFPFFASVIILAGCFLVRFDRPLVSVAINVALLGCALLQFPIHIDRSDMLVVTQNALDLWAKGMDPYLELHERGRPVIYGYLPGIFISHFPAWVFEIDLRWNNLIYRALWLLLLLKLIKKSSNQKGLIPFHYLALSPYINFRHELYFEAFLLLLVAYFALPKTRYFSLPLMLVTRQWSWVLAPFLVLDDLRKHPKCHFKIAGWYVLGGFITALGFYWILGPVVVWKAVLEKIFWFQKVVGDDQFKFDYGLNFKWLFLKLGLLHWMQKLQAVLVAGVFLGVLTKRLKGSILNWAAITLILFVMLNGHFWLYFWNTPIVFSLLAATTEEI